MVKPLFTGSNLGQVEVDMGRPWQAVGGGEEGTPTNPPQTPPGTASRLACRFASRRCPSISGPFDVKVRVVYVELNCAPKVGHKVKGYEKKRELPKVCPCDEALG